MKPEKFGNLIKKDLVEFRLVKSILRLFYDADLAYTNEDDIQHMLLFGKATEETRAYFAQKEKEYTHTNEVT